MKSKKQILKLRIKRMLAYFICPHMRVVRHQQNQQLYIIQTRKWWQRRYRRLEIVRRPQPQKAVRYALQKYTRYYLEVPKVRKARKK